MSGISRCWGTRYETAATILGGGAAPGIYHNRGAFISSSAYVTILCFRSPFNLLTKKIRQSRGGTTPMESIINLLQFFRHPAGLPLSERYSLSETSDTVIFSADLLLWLFLCTGLPVLDIVSVIVFPKHHCTFLCIGIWQGLQRYFSLSPTIYSLLSGGMKLFLSEIPLLAPLIEFRQCHFYCTFGDIPFSNPLPVRHDDPWVPIKFHPRSCLRRDTDGKRTEPVFHRNPLLCCGRIHSVDLRPFPAMGDSLSSVPIAGV